MTQETPETNVIVKAEKMREIAARNPTSHALLLYLALYSPNQEELNVSFLRTELHDRGVEINENQLFDALQDLEDLGLGSIVYAKEGQGEDIFKRGYNLGVYAKRAFPVEYLNEWSLKVDQEDGIKVKLLDPNFKFQETKEEQKKKIKEAVGPRGRPFGYSMKLGRYLTPEEIKEREEAKKNKRPRGRPVGWRKYSGQEGEKRRKELAMKKSTGKRGRPAGYSPKLGRFLTAKELAEMGNKAPRKRGRPAGSGKAKSLVKRQPRASKAAVNGVSPGLRTSKAYKILNIPLSYNRNIRIELPKKLSKDEVALLNLNIEHLVKSS